MKKHLVVLTGAGISAESGIATFRASDGLWENHRIEDVASPEGWRRNPQLVLDFYNERRLKAAAAKPNKGHLILKALEDHFEVSIITQNVDGLHEKAGSKSIIHLHGELSKGRSSKTDGHYVELGDKPIKIGDKAADNSQLRPHIVWFGEAVPMIERAVEITASADVLVIVGTSMQVYPAASLIQYIGNNVPVYVIDPNKPTIQNTKNITYIEDIASIGLAKLQHILLDL